MWIFLSKIPVGAYRVDQITPIKHFCLGLIAGITYLADEGSSIRALTVETKSVNCFKQLSTWKLSGWAESVHLDNFCKMKK